MTQKTSPKKSHVPAGLIAVGMMAGSLVLGGCVPAAVVGTGKAASTGAQERTVGNAVDDTWISLQISDRWFRHSEAMFNKLDLTVNEGKVLITGILDDPDQRVDAVRLAWQVKGVREVINEIQVAKSEGIRGYARDSRIIAELRTKILFDRSIRSINYTIETVGGVVYLMGVAWSQQELDRVVDHARNIESVRRVVSYVRLRDQDPAQMVGAPPSSIASPGSSSVTEGDSGTRLPDGSVSHSPSFDPRSFNSGAKSGNSFADDPAPMVYDGPNDAPVETETLTPVK